LEHRARSRGSSPLGDASSGVAASFSLKQRCHGPVHSLECFLIDPQFSRSPDPFGYPSRSNPRSLHSEHGRFRLFHLALFERGPFMFALRRSRSFRFEHLYRWSRSRTVFFASFDV
jgi:hypothetical protein